MRKRQGDSENKTQYDRISTDDKLIFNFRDISHTMRSLYEGRGSQKGILMALLEMGTITQQKLTERQHIRPGSASEVLAKLEKGGWIMRSVSNTDRRTTDVSLTEQGTCEAMEALAQRKQRHKEMFACLTEDEKESLLYLLEKINENWREKYQKTGSGNR